MDTQVSEQTSFPSSSLPSTDPKWLWSWTRCRVKTETPFFFLMLCSSIMCVFNREFYDTIGDDSSGWNDSNCKVKFKALDIGGRTIMHCHILKHEDNGLVFFCLFCCSFSDVLFEGAMGWVNFQGPGMDITPTSPCCTTASGCSTCIDENNLPNSCSSYKKKVAKKIELVN